MSGWTALRRRDAITRVAFTVALGALTPAADGVRAQTAPLLRGTVLDRATAAPIPSVEVTLVGRPSRALTDSLGAFAIARPPSGSAVLVFRRLGLRPGTLAVALAPNDTTPLVFAMERVAQELGEVTIEGAGVTGLSARLAGFEERRARGVGRFITEADIERRSSARTSDLLLDVRGIDVREVVYGGTIVISRRGMKLQPGTGMPVECPIPVVVDGGMRISDLNDVPPQLIAGIEVYAGPGTVPPQYANMSNYTQCGLVLIWTRSGTPRR